MKNPLLLLLLFFPFSFLFAQNFLGYANSNYSGVYGIDLQPASIADNRRRIDFNLTGASASLYNNYLGIQSSLLSEFAGNLDTLLTGQFDRSSFPEYLNEQEKFVYIQQDVQLPSLMLSLGRKQSIALHVPDSHLCQCRSHQ